MTVKVVNAWRVQSVLLRDDGWHEVLDGSFAIHSDMRIDAHSFEAPAFTFIADIEGARISGLMSSILAVYEKPGATEGG